MTFIVLVFLFFNISASHYCQNFVSFSDFFTHCCIVFFSLFCLAILYSFFAYFCFILLAFTCFMLNQSSSNSRSNHSHSGNCRCSRCCSLPIQCCQNNTQRLGCINVLVLSLLQILVAYAFIHTYTSLYFYSQYCALVCARERERERERERKRDLVSWLVINGQEQL